MPSERPTGNAAGTVVAGRGTVVAGFVGAGGAVSGAVAGGVVADGVVAGGLVVLGVVVDALVELVELGFVVAGALVTAGSVVGHVGAGPDVGTGSDGVVGVPSVTRGAAAQAASAISRTISTVERTGITRASCPRCVRKA
ncbi:MAG: hypothetical protein ACOYMR_01305 [Ilumatobacteraceae bacterium]